MGAFKKLNKQDVFVTSYTSKKEWTVSSSELNNYGIVIETGISNETGSLYPGNANYTASLKYSSLQHLYYSNFISSSISGSFENYIQSSLESGSRTLNNVNALISIPRNVVGSYIEPGTFTIETPFVDMFLEEQLFTVFDDGEGKVKYNSTSIEIDNLVETTGTLGDIIYTHGIIVLNESSGLTDFFLLDNPSTYKWQSNYPILTQNVICKVSDYEFNFTQNPSAVISGSFGKFKDNITGSDFRPYITAVGLYNDANELIAVAKLGQPLPKPSYIDTTFIIKLDL